jgi:hypothetical protein
MRMSVAFSFMEGGLRIIVVYNYMYLYSPKYTGIYNRVHIVRIAMRVMWVKTGRRM